MPFATVMAPSIGLSLLKAGLAQRGIPSKIHYFSIRFAELLGWSFYGDIAHGTGVPFQELAGEWIFNRALFGASLEDDKQYVQDILRRRTAWTQPMPRIERSVVDAILRARTRVDRFLDGCLERVLDDEPRIVGFTSSFQQHIASLALARRIRERRPDVAIIFGGANCQGAAGAETVRQFPFVDAAVSGEGDIIVPQLFERLLARKPIDGLPGVRTPEELERRPPFWSDAPIIEDLDSLPFVDYSDFFEQFRASRFGRTWEPNVFFESSRGCWWGQKTRCTFCGLDRPAMSFRSKSAGHAFEEIVHLTKAHPRSDVQFIDNILDMKYFDHFIPELAKLHLKVAVFCETKSNLRKDHVRKLRKAGIVLIQPGIESFSDSVLRLMRKGVTGLQNIQLLKWCRELGIRPYWNFMWGFPGEDAEEYRRMADLVPLLSHLPPPDSTGELRLDRFSPNFEQAPLLGFTDVRPLESYRYVYPLPEEALRNLAYSFSYRHQDGRSPAAYVGSLERRLESWESTARDADMFFVDLGKSIVICDLRPRAKRFLSVLSGIDREIYLAADSVTDARTLSHSLGGTPEQITRRLDRMVRLQLTLRAGHRYLALAIPVGDYQPSSRSRMRFRQAVRKVGKRVPEGTSVELAQPVPVTKGRRPAHRRRLPKRIDASLFEVQSERTLIVRDCR
jgi:ribosomal peptide maturation radical SAM protein 1